MLLKPTRGSLLNKSHPLARGLVGYWLLNEGSGNKVFDLSGNRKNLDFYNSPIWSPGKFGSAILFDDGSSQFIGRSLVGTALPTAAPMTMICWFNSNDTTTNQVLMSIGDNGGNENMFALSARGDVDQTVRAVLRSTAQSWVYSASASTFSANTWHQAAAVFASSTSRTVYLDRVAGTPETTSCIPLGLDAIAIGRGERATPFGYMSGLISYAMIWNRALSASEIDLLYREPFCMFDRASWNLKFQISNFKFLAGTSTALSSVEGSLSVSGPIVELSGNIAGTSNINGYLRLLDWTEASWLTDALFNGMTANAFKLGTSLSLGWFWVRVNGCSALYRGRAGGSMGEIDFGGGTAILAVSEQNAREISPPNYIPHNNGSTYFYVVRRFNNCGYQEHTLAAAVKVIIDDDSGELAEPQPNNIANWKVEQVDSNKVRLLWFYCPIEQGSIPIRFNVYYDDRTGQIDYETPLNTDIIEYKGRRFYSFQSSDLETGGGASEHLFAIRAEDAGSIENISLARLKIQLDTLRPDAIDILRAEAV